MCVGGGRTSEWSAAAQKGGEKKERGTSNDDVFVNAREKAREVEPEKQLNYMYFFEGRKGQNHVHVYSITDCCKRLCEGIVLDSHTE